jgi:predicted dehydrogenase
MLLCAVCVFAVQSTLRIITVGRIMLHAPIRIALLGAGIYMREAHAPAIRATQQYQVAVIYSRTQESAQRLAATFDYAIDTSTDLDAVLGRSDIDAVDIALPIDHMPEVVRKALAAGKHVISEKPIAPTVAAGRDLLAYKTAYPAQAWMVAENWRYEAAFGQSKLLLDEGAIGDARSAHWAVNIRMETDNPYYQTTWRQQPQYQGGFLFDAGVHHAAAWRLLLGEVAQVSAFTTQMRADLPPIDTLSAALRFDSGIIASYAVSFAAGVGLPETLTIVGSDGALRIERSHIEIVRGKDVERHQMWDAYPRSNVSVFNDFAAVVRGEKTNGTATPEAALGDVALLEACFRSAESRRAEAVERV